MDLMLNTCTELESMMCKKNISLSLADLHNVLAVAVCQVSRMVLMRSYKEIQLVAN